MKHEKESGISSGSSSAFQRKSLLAFRKILTCSIILAWEQEGRNGALRSLYFQWCLTELLAAPWYNKSAEPERELHSHSGHLSVERQEVTSVNCMWEETFLTVLGSRISLLKAEQCPK